MMYRRGDLVNSNRGQLTIFIIIAITIVAFGAVSYFLFPQLLINLGIGTNNPQTFLQTCMEDQVKEVVEKISLQGGSLEPRNSIKYQNNDIEYLCYINQYYLPCIVQQPFLKQHIENEIKEALNADSKSCLSSLRENFERQGYDVRFTNEEINVEILPERISINFDNELTLTKDGSQRYERLSIFLNNNLYELIGIANSIINFEARFGDAETTAYMYYYNNLKVEKILQSDGSTVYIITERSSGNKFQFASRSVAWPPGIGLDGIR